jgi:hypothetical protein
MIDYTKIDPLLGIRTDLSIAREFGCSHTIIARRRRKLSIGKGKRKRKHKLESYADMLGRMPDTEIAKMIHCHKATVQRYRESLRISAFRR